MRSALPVGDRPLARNSSKRGRWGIVAGAYWFFFLLPALPAMGGAYIMQNLATGIFIFAVICILLVNGRMMTSYLGKATRAVYASLVAVSLSYGATYLYFLFNAAFDTGPRDLLELARYPIVLLLVWLLLKARQRVTREAVLGYCIIPSVYVSAVLLAIYVGKVPMLYDVIEALYGGSKSAVNLAARWFSWALPFENPNFLGLYMVWCLACTLFFTPRIRFIFTGLCMLMIVVSGSRTAWVSGGIVLTAWIIGALLTRDRRRAALVLVGGLLVSVVFSITVLDIDWASMARVQLVTNAIRKGSILLESNIAFRVDQARFLISKVLAESPLVGFGPSKYSVADVIDSQYVLWLTRTGVIGTMLMMWFYGSIAFWRPFLFFVRQRKAYLALGVACFSAATGISLLTGAFLDNLRLLFLGGAMLFLVVANPATRRRTAND